MNMDYKNRLLNKTNKMCIVGLGYVGLQLACEFGKYITGIGFDVNKDKINQYKKGIDCTDSVDKGLLNNINFTCNEQDMNDSNITVFIICVPTPINNDCSPDLSYVKNASILVGKHLKKDDVVIYESTVAPGTTRTICIPLLEKYSKLKFNIDFNAGFSPERLQPGVGGKHITDITKIVSGGNCESLEGICDVYSIIMGDKIYKCSSIEVAETSKMMENVKRDVNIALMNEFSILCHKYDIDVMDVINAAKTKFNFDSVEYYPGLVGGHCIGVDPYYLTDDIKNNCNNDIILKARALNESIVNYIKDSIVNIVDKKYKVCMLGITFKENCNDVRNSKAVELYKLLIKDGYDVSVYDPVCDVEELYKQYGNINMVNNLYDDYDCIIIVVKHSCFLAMLNKIECSYFIFDIKSMFNDKQLKEKGHFVWSL